MKTAIVGGVIVNEGRTFAGSVIVEDDHIADIIEGQQQPEASYDQVKDASGCYVLPGIIDDHVHFREPGLTDKADIDTESRAAAAGGITSFFDMPNTVPQTTTLEALEEKFCTAARKSHVNYSFFFGATNDNYPLFPQLPAHRIPGIKLFMGSSTGNMLVDRDEALEHIFASAKLPLMAHCEDTAIIDRNMTAFREQFGDDPDVRLHPLIRSEEACMASTVKAIQLAVRHGARLHIAHVTTAEELRMFTPAPLSLRNTRPLITAEATVGHLYFSLTDYQRLGARIKVNPAIKNFRDCQALRDGLADGRVTVVGTDHAPHLLEQKQGGCAKAASGMPMIQFSLVTMLELVDEGVLTIERLVQLMCHNPALLFGVENRGFLRKGCQADIVIVRPHSPWTVTKDTIQSKCGWSPMEGHEYQWRVEQTLCNGHTVYSNGKVDTDYLGEEIRFQHT
ncbi:MAG: dihydroorotase [Prevotella sp.]|nr:dihydroorotase [Prevotella sp.]